MSALLSLAGRWAFAAFMLVMLVYSTGLVVGMPVWANASHRSGVPSGPFHVSAQGAPASIAKGETK